MTPVGLSHLQQLWQSTQ